MWACCERLKRSCDDRREKGGSLAVAKARVTVELSDMQRRLLELIAEQEGAPLPEVVRVALVLELVGQDQLRRELRRQRRMRPVERRAVGATAQADRQAGG